MKTSVIVIVKDTKSYLRKCLDSIKNQTLLDIEVIVVDDHSMEKSDDIISCYSKDMNIRYDYMDEDVGPGGARNKGLEHCDGTFVCFIDSDDWLDLDYLETAVSLMSEHHADIGMCGLVRNYDTNAYKPRFKCLYKSSTTIDGISAFRMVSGQYDFGVVVSPSPVNKLYKQEFLENNRIRFLENVYYEDVLFMFQCFLTNCKVITVPGVCYHHYCRMGSIVQSLTNRHFDDFYTVFSKTKAFLKDSGLYDEYAFNYYKVIERFYNLLIRQVFQFSKNDCEKKEWMKYSFHKLKQLIELDEYMKYSSAEDIRRHLQPFLEDTSLL